jgi:RNA polymerase sigma-70 factor (ECF subfamily)
MTDQEAIARLKERDIDALEVLVKRYHARAIQSAYLILSDWQLAEDVAQSAFVNAYERIHGFDDSRAFGPWFLRTVINLALKEVDRKQKVLRNSQDGDSDLEIPDPDPSAVDILEAAETRDEIVSALHQLSPGQRAAIVMKYYLGLTDLEVSNRLDVPAGTVRRRLHDARKRLRKLLPLYRPE